VAPCADDHVKVTGELTVVFNGPIKVTGAFAQTAAVVNLMQAVDFVGQPGPTASTRHSYVVPGFKPPYVRLVPEVPPMSMEHPLPTAPR